MLNPELQSLVRELEDLTDWIIMARANGPAEKLPQAITRKLIVITNQYRPDDMEGD